MNILEKIVAAKRREVAERKAMTSVRQLEVSPFFQTTPPSMLASLMDPAKNGIIAEFKRRSPSKGDINVQADVHATTRDYAAGGASGISVLTDETFFGGGWKDLDTAVRWGTPVLRKDFIIDEYQLLEARSHGASVILLIAACLTPGEAKQLAMCAKAMELEVLLELHDPEEMFHMNSAVTFVGINNRNLKNFEVNMQQSMEMVEQLPNDLPAIAESGIDSISTLLELEDVGFKGFLMGEYFMRQSNPGAAFLSFSDELKNARARRNQI
ncbi:MAG: indole-3-glycerol-phosphate synthase [Chitinophagaceae bacterium]|nr:indole-3-glycerol-phosphate synthase [Chitinophagaceae bacterium]MCA6479742.1 indole-3-glycerol-phosphate synthase [Chitinophagaceae bacterium]